MLSSGTYFSRVAREVGRSMATTDSFRLYGRIACSRLLFDRTVQQAYTSPGWSSAESFATSICGQARPCQLIRISRSLVNCHRLRSFTVYTLAEIIARVFFTPRRAGRGSVSHHRAVADTGPGEGSHVVISPWLMVPRPAWRQPGRANPTGAS